MSVLWPILAAGCAAGAVAFYRRGQMLAERLKQAETEKHEQQEAATRFQLEETRVFDFLHDISDALAGHARVEQLHRLIVEGAVRILEADAGALFIGDGTGEYLRPAFVQKEFPPLTEPPANAGRTPVERSQWWRVQAVRSGEGPLGEVWKAMGTDTLRRMKAVNGWDALLCALVCGGNVVGVLAIARTDEGDEFPVHTEKVFQALADQAAFALHNERVFAAAAEARKVDEDLQNAWEIQRILLPQGNPTISGWDVAGLNVPARYVSGDYLDFFPVSETHDGIVVADVSGKGVPASLIMVMFRSLLRTLAPGQLSPSATLREVNRLIYPDIHEEKFVSSAYAVLERGGSGVINLCRAGHDAPLLYRAATGQVEKVKPRGVAVGIDSGDTFNRVCADFSLVLAPGDCLLFYTDGVTEALNGQEEEFGPERVIQALLASAHLGASAVLARITEDVKTFVGQQPQHDDITLIAICKT